MNYLVLIIGDDPTALQTVRAHLAAHQDFEIRGESTSGAEAVGAITAIRPDLVLLDAKIPRMGGFEVLRRGGATALPLLILLSHREEHALRAFDLQAVDFLLKPIDEARLAVALERARQHLRRRRPPIERLEVRRGERTLLIPLEEIRWISAAGDYVTLCTADDRYLLRRTMASLERDLDSRFVRIHRRAIVRLDCIAELRARSRGTYDLTLRDGTALRLSRRYREAFLAALRGSRSMD